MERAWLGLLVEHTTPLTLVSDAKTCLRPYRAELFWRLYALTTADQANG